MPPFTSKSIAPSIPATTFVIVSVTLSAGGSSMSTLMVIEFEPSEIVQEYVPSVRLAMDEPVWPFDQR